MTISKVSLRSTEVACADTARRSAGRRLPRLPARCPQSFLRGAPDKILGKGLDSGFSGCLGAISPRRGSRRSRNNEPENHQNEPRSRLRSEFRHWNPSHPRECRGIACINHARRGWLSLRRRSHDRSGESQGDDQHRNVMAPHSAVRRFGRGLRLSAACRFVAPRMSYFWERPPG